VVRLLNNMVCKSCGEETLQIDKDTTFVKQEELIKDQEESNKKGICLRCYWGQWHGGKTIK